MCELWSAVVGTFQPNLSMYPSLEAARVFLWHCTFLPLHTHRLQWHSLSISLKYRLERPQWRIFNPYEQCSCPDYFVVYPIAFLLKRVWIVCLFLVRQNVLGLEEEGRNSSECCVKRRNVEYNHRWTNIAALSQKSTRFVDNISECETRLNGTSFLYYQPLVLFGNVFGIIIKTSGLRNREDYKRALDDGLGRS